METQCSCYSCRFYELVSDVEYIINDCKPELVIYSDTTKEVVLDACKGQQYGMELFNLEKLSAVDEAEKIWSR